MTNRDGKTPAGDAELVRRLKAGEESAVEELFHRFQAKAYGICLGILKDDADARDTAQEALEQVTRNIAQFDGRSRFSTWLYRVVANYALMRLRKTVRRAKVTITIELPEAENVAVHQATLDAEPAADRQLISDDATAAVETLCAQLPEKFCPIVALVDLQNRSVPEAASELGLSVANAKSRLHRGRVQLRKLICDLGELCGPWCARK
jgi:RNA polymerase sigma factor (sigma-70 family)